MRTLPSSWLGLLALLAVPIVVALYGALLFGSLAVAVHALHWLMRAL